MLSDAIGLQGQSFYLARPNSLASRQRGEAEISGAGEAITPNCWSNVLYSKTCERTYQAVIPFMPIALKM